MSSDEAAGRFERARPARVLVVGRDRRFLMFATAELARLGYYTIACDRPSQIVELVDTRDLSVVVVDGSEYLASICRSMASIDRLSNPVGLVTVAEDSMISPLTSSRILPKWASLGTLHVEVERAYAKRTEEKADVAAA